MDITFAPEVEAYRLEVRDYIAGLLPDGWTGIGALEGEAFDEMALSIRMKMREAGYVAVSWPKEYGGQGLTQDYQVVIAEELTRAGLPHGIFNDGFSIQMFGNTLMHWGTEEQKERFIPKILDCEYIFCQGYSEPGSGSDLGSLRTRAEQDGDVWRINGQKIWTSEAHQANWIFVLVRTDPTAEKHKGLTLLACPLEQEGIEVRPIKQIHGDKGFNEVFFTDAVTDVSNTIGPVNEGWRVAMSLLEFERGGAAAVLAPRFVEELERTVELARSVGRLDDPEVRRKLAWCHSRVLAMRLMGYRGLTKLLRGTPPGPESAMTKLYWSEYHRVAMELVLDLLGEQALVIEGSMPPIMEGPTQPGEEQNSATWVGAYLANRASTIYAGTNQIQRNILAERVLGMPR